MKTSNHTNKVLKTLRKRTTLSQRKVAATLGRSQSYVSKIERGLKIPKEGEVKNILKILNQKEADYDSLMKTQIYLAKLAQIDESKSAVEEKKIPLRNLTKTEVIELVEDYFKNKEVEKAWLFGSFAREEQTTESDIDLLIQFDENYKATLIDLIRMKHQLEEITGHSVDIVESGSEYEYIRSNIHQDTISVYG